jgi:hypothetical protein
MIRHPIGVARISTIPQTMYVSTQYRIAASASNQMLSMSCCGHGFVADSSFVSVAILERGGITPVNLSPNVFEEPTLVP